MSANSTHSHHATYGTAAGVAGDSATGAGKIYAGSPTAYENFAQLGSTQDISHTHSVTSNVTITNVNNSAANAASAHDNMQPTMVLNYIIKAL
jgi:microcystin-dependent protein